MAKLRPSSGTPKHPSPSPPGAKSALRLAESAPATGSLGRGRLVAVVFDLDGTLVDSAPDIHAALNRVLAESDLPPRTMEAVKLMIGDGAISLVAQGYAAAGAPLAGVELERRYRRFLDLYEGAGSASLTRPYPGVVETLTRLTNPTPGLRLGMGLRLGICTNKPEIATRDVLRALGLDRFFAASVSPEQVPAHKPDPAHLLAVLEALDATPGNAVMVGDNGNDVAMARAAGVPVIAVSYGYPRMAPAALGADLLIDRMDELPAALERFGTRRPGA